MSDVPSVVYHYCSLEVFLSIIKNSTIRLTNISKSNDTNEVKYCFETFQKALKGACLMYAKSSAINQEDKEFFKNIDYESLVSKAVINDSLIYYTACFSTQPDLLSQWRGYTNDGKGVALGFYSNNFLGKHDLKFHHITYDMSEAKREIECFIIKKLKEVSRKGNNKNYISEYENVIEEVITDMVYNAVFYKNPAFQEENEWRLVFYPFGNIRNLLIFNKTKELASSHLFYDRMDESIKYKRNIGGLIIDKIHFRCTDRKIISYVDVDFSNIKNNMLAEIIIGPKSEINDRDLRLFLMSNEYDFSKINIRKSNATYQ